MSDRIQDLLHKTIEQRTLETLERIETILDRAFPAPGHTDLMVSPEAIDEVLEVNAIDADEPYFGVPHEEAPAETTKPKGKRTRK